MHDRPEPLLHPDTLAPMRLKPRGELLHPRSSHSLLGSAGDQLVSLSKQRPAPSFSELATEVLGAVGSAPMLASVGLQRGVQSLPLPGHSLYHTEQPHAWGREECGHAREAAPRVYQSEPGQTRGNVGSRHDAAALQPPQLAMGGLRHGEPDTSGSTEGPIVRQPARDSSGGNHLSADVAPTGDSSHDAAEQLQEHSGQAEEQAQPWPDVPSGDESAALGKTPREQERAKQTPREVHMLAREEDLELKRQELERARRREQQMLEEREKVEQEITRERVQAQERKEAWEQERASMAREREEEREKMQQEITRERARAQERKEAWEQDRASVAREMERDKEQLEEERSQHRQLLEAEKEKHKELQLALETFMIMRAGAYGMCDVMVMLFIVLF